MAQNAIRWTLRLALFVALSGGAGLAVAVDAKHYLVGLGLHQETGRNIYLGGVYLDEGTPRPSSLTLLSGPMIMEYRVVARRTSIRSLLGGMLLQSEVATGRSPNRAATNFADAILSTVKSSLYSGDSFQIRLDGSGETSALLNGHELARVPNSEVAEYLFQGWIGENGPSTNFRADLTASTVNPTLLSTLNGNTYTTSREKQVAAWFEPLNVSTGTVDTGVVSEITTTELEPEPTAESAAVVADVAEPTKPENVAEPVEPELASALPVSPAADAAPVDPLLNLPEVPGSDGALQMASLTPTSAMLLPSSDVRSLGVQEYSQRLSDFHGGIVAMVYKNIRYPNRAVRRNLQGRVELDVTIQKSGKLLGIAVAQSSGHQILDDAAVKAAEDALSTTVLNSIDPVAIAEFGDVANTLIVPIPVSFKLTR